MKFKVSMLIAFVVMIAATVVISTAPKSEPQQRPQEIQKLEKKEKQGAINLNEAARLAKSRGQQKISVPSLKTLYLGIASNPDELDEKLSGYTVVLAKLVEKKSYLADEAVVRTWNKFAVVETLTQAPPRPTHFPWPSVPEELLPVKEDELLVHTQGGSITIDGVEVIQRDDAVPAFLDSKKYLLVISLDPGTRMGWLELGPQSLLQINDDDTLDAGKDQHLLQQVIKGRYGSSVKQLKDKLKNLPAPDKR